MNFAIGPLEVIILGVIVGILVLKRTLGARDKSLADTTKQSHPNLQQCPGCGAHVSPENDNCPACGLRISL